MSKRQKTSSRAFIPALHLEYCIQRSAVERFPDVTSNLKTMLSARTLDRLEGTLRVLVGLSKQGLVTATQKYIGAIRGKSDRALRDDLRDLEALGLVETIQNYDKGALRVRNTYRLHPMVYLWQQGKARAVAATKAIVAATEGLTSRMVRRMQNLHKAYREAAQSNLKRGTAAPDCIERKIVAELTASFTRKDRKGNEQALAEPTPALIAQVVKLVRMLGFDEAAKIVRSVPKEQLRCIWNANKHIDAAA